MIVYSPNGKQLASGSGDTIKIWDIESNTNVFVPNTFGTCIKTLKTHSAEVYSIAYSPCGKQLASGSDNRTIRIWDLQTGEYVEHYKVIEIGLSFVAYR